eukprot:6132113-Pyramimonas_sp.AAC.1
MQGCAAAAAEQRRARPQSLYLSSPLTSLYPDSMPSPAGFARPISIYRGGPVGLRYHGPMGMEIGST